MSTDQFKKIPGVDTLLNHPDLKQLKSHYGNNLITYSIRQTLKNVRDSVVNGEKTPDEKRLIAKIKSNIESINGTSLKRVVNATGIILHTNLGRAPLGKEILDAIEPIVLGYSNLEFDLDSGKRGKRGSHIRDLINYITGAEQAVVVNNNAAAVSLTLRTLAENKEVIISRGELIEIGGSFRLPDIMAASGATMVEVGTTNKTRLIDYEQAITNNTAMILKAHKSNYYIEGYTDEVELGELSKLSRKHNLILVYDIGSGLLKKLDDSRLQEEPDVQNSLKEGVDLITFSCDKLLGGPQAGIIAGKQKYIASIAHAPLMRTYRVDKITIAALSAAINYYLKDENLHSGLPIYKIMGKRTDELLKTAQLLKKELKKYEIDADIEHSEAQIGGGTVPNKKLQSYSVKLNTDDNKQSEKIFYRLLKADVPILGILKKGELHFDILCVDEKEIPFLAKSISGNL